MAAGQKLTPKSSRAITAAQVRAARAYLGLQQHELADEAGVERKTVMEFERRPGAATPETTAAIRAAVERLGIRFLFSGGRGVGITEKN